MLVQLNTILKSHRIPNVEFTWKIIKANFA